MTILPLRNLLLVTLRPEETTKGSLIILHDHKLARPADVVRAGPEVKDIKQGDVVIVNALAGTTVGEFLLIPETAVLGTL